MQLPLLTAGLSLFSVLRAEGPQLVPAHTHELLGNWFIKRWAGTMPIPKKKRFHPLPPFAFGVNALGKMEFRMNLTKPIRCIQYKLPLYQGRDPGDFSTWWRQIISIHFLPGKEHAIVYSTGQMDGAKFHMMMLVGRSLDESPAALSIFQGFVESKGINKTEIINPLQAGACVLASA